VDHEAVRLLLRLHAAAPQLGDDGGDPVGLLATDEADARHPGRSLGEDGHGRQRLRRVGELAEVDVDAAERAHAGDLGPPRRALDVRAHLRQHVDEGEVPLHGARAQPLHPDPPPADGGSGEEVRRGAGVWLDGVVGRPVAAGRHRERAVVGDVDPGGEGAHRGDGEVEVRTGDGRGRELQDQAVGHQRPCQQEPGQELAGDVGADGDAAAPQPVAPDDGDGEPTGLAGGLDPGAERGQRLEGGAHGPGPQLRVAVEAVRGRSRGPAAARGSGPSCPTGGRRAPRPGPGAGRRCPPPRRRLRPRRR
jgi:hypothetical protein